jgi:hypothetical protein
MNRTPEQDRMMQQLLSQVTGEILATPEGKIFRQALTSEEEELLRTIPVLSDEPPGWDGSACDMCRGFTRLVNCPKCWGTYDNVRKD